MTVQPLKLKLQKHKNEINYPMVEPNLILS